MSAVGVHAAADADILATPQAGGIAARGAAMRMGSFIGGSLLSAGAAALLFRHLGVVDSGRYTTAMSLAAVVTGLTDLGLTSIGTRELAVLKGPQRAKLARNLLGLRLALTAIGVLLISAFAFAAYGRLLGVGVLIASGGALVQNTQTTLAVPLMARLRLGWVAGLDLTRQISTAALIALLVLAGGHLLAFLAVTALAACIVLPPTVMLVVGDIPIKPSFDLAQWRRLLGPVIAYSLAVITATLYLRVAVVLVSLIASHRQLGYFSLSYRVVESLLTLPGLLLSSAFPILAQAARHDPERLEYALARLFEVSLIIGAWVSLSLLVGSRLAIDVLGGPSFHPATAVLAVQGVVVGAVFVSSVWAYGLLSLHLHRVILVFNLVLLVVMTITVAVLASLYGALGAAAGTASVEIAAAIAGAVVLTRARPFLKPRLGVVPKVLVAVLVGATPMLLTALPAIGRIGLSTMLYGVVLLALRAVPPDLPQALLGLRRRA
jgi:O-antigen/teichoic acid export membrane protein